MLYEALKLRLPTAYTPEELKEIRKINAMEWSNESHALQSQAYGYGNLKVSNTCVVESKKTIAIQIKKAG